MPDIEADHANAANGRMIEGSKAVSVSPCKGVWPNWRSRLWRQDLRRGKRVQGADGIRFPRFQTPDWLRRSKTEAVRDTAKEMMEAANDRVSSAERRAAGVFDASWKLLAIALTTTGFEASRLRSAGVAWWAGICVLVPNVLAVVALSLSALQGLTASSRVGVTWELEIENISKRKPVVNAQAVDYWHAAQTIDWTAGHKLDDVLLAQAWLSRGIVALVVSAVLAVGVWTISSDGTSTAPSPTTTVSSAPGTTKP